MLIAKNGTQYNQITNEIIKAHATYVNSPFVKVSRVLNYRTVDGRQELVDDFTPEELKAGLREIAKIADVQTRELYINKFFSSNKSEAQQIINQTLANTETYISKASWGLNWNAPILISPRIIAGFEEPFEIPDDGAIFLWGGDFLNFDYNSDVRTKLQILPKNYTALSGENIEGYQVPQYPQFARLFAKSAQDKTETIGKENAGVFFSYGQTDHGNLSSMTNYPYTTTLSFIPVRQGDKVFLQDIGGNDVGLTGIFFPFER